MVLPVMSSGRRFKPSCERFSVSLVLVIMVVAYVTVIMISMTNFHEARVGSAVCTRYR